MISSTEKGDGKVRAEQLCTPTFAYASWYKSRPALAYPDSIALRSL